MVSGPGAGMLPCVTEYGIFPLIFLEREADRIRSALRQTPLGPQFDELYRLRPSSNYSDASTAQWLILQSAIWKVIHIGYDAFATAHKAASVVSAG